MEAYKEDVVVSQPESKIFGIYNKTRSWLAASLGVILTIVGMAVVFVVSTLEGTKEVKASNSDSAQILNIWREAEGVGLGVFPEEKSDIVEYDGKQYYFIVEQYTEEGQVAKWYFAYDGGFDYIFGDYKFYVLTGLTIGVSMYISYVNYKSTISSGMKTDDFRRTLVYYQKCKDGVNKYTQYIPDFCIYKNQQMYDNARRDIVESAGLNYAFYNSDKFVYEDLAKWQKKVLRQIEKIKVEKIHSSDLLQEHNQIINKISLLPMSQSKHQKRFLISGSIQKIFMSALSGLVVAFGVVMGNWFLGLTYGLTIFINFIFSIIIAADFVSSTLRNRFIGKGDLLTEFDNIKERFIEKPNNTLSETKPN